MDHSRQLVFLVSAMFFGTSAEVRTYTRSCDWSLPPLPPTGSLLGQGPQANADM